MWRIAAFVSLGAATFGIGWGLDRAGLPSAYLFAALLVGLAVALALPGRVTIPGVAFGAGQAFTGVAGGAYGIVAMADDLGADGRLVAFMQYLRVLVVVMLTPLLIAVIFPGHHTGAA